MYAVIFKAKVRDVDEEYFSMAKKMRKMAFEDYGCIDFISVCEENTEISISYWKDLESIKIWKEDKEHLKAQELGKTKWYESYTIEITEILNTKIYKFPK